MRLLMVMPKTWKRAKDFLGFIMQKGRPIFHTQDDTYSMTFSINLFLKKKIYYRNGYYTFHTYGIIHQSKRATHTDTDTQQLMYINGVKMPKCYIIMRAPQAQREAGWLWYTRS